MLRPLAVVMKDAVALLKVLSLTPPRGSEFQAEVKKKISRLSHTKTYTGTGLSHRQTDPYIRVGQGLEIFSTYVRKLSLRNTISWGGLTSAGRVFFLCLIQQVNLKPLP